MTDLTEPKKRAKHPVDKKTTASSEGIALNSVGVNFSKTLSELLNTPLHPCGSNSLVPPK
ncbi:hypothetical protein HK104_004942, partial [Borealophlyctis nickersoniae]